MFGDDVAALQRYRMLVALIRERRPTAEVARAFGVSRESLRRLRRAFVQGDLAALRSRRRGGGHFARGSALAQMLRDALAQDPRVPGSVLWERIEAQLKTQGLAAPRSTFYRLLARLRDEESDEGGGRTAANLLRDALSGLLEDPPLDLGRSQLAELILPEERDQFQRGRRMAAALSAAIEQLHPADELDPNDPRWRSYRILAGEYLDARERSELEAELALSTSTYSRAKREAIDQLRTILPSVIDATPTPQPLASVDLEALNDTIGDLLALMPSDDIRNLAVEQRKAALELLKPVEALIAALRRGRRR